LSIIELVFGNYIFKLANCYCHTHEINFSTKASIVTRSLPCPIDELSMT